MTAGGDAQPAREPVRAGGASITFGILIALRDDHGSKVAKVAKVAKMAKVTMMTIPQPYQTARMQGCSAHEPPRPRGDPPLALLLLRALLLREGGSEIGPRERNTP